ncbi:MAG TPA: phosphatidate cytidylyltransferase [Cytophagaceae bacterium]|nr:phosphatidate cytidylyltransferase [Cytophagaceae bacterium]
MNFGLNKFNNLTQRIIAGVIGGALVIGMVVMNEWTYFALFFAICLLALREFFNLLKAAEIKANKYFGITAGMVIYIAIFLIEKKIIPFNYYFLIFPFLFLLFLIELFQHNEKPFLNIAFTFLGIIYIAFPFALLHSCAIHLGEYNHHIILGILFLLWANDVGGYVAGMMLGKNKLFMRVSPKKTWEGSTGGGLLSVFTALTLSVIFRELNPFQWLVMSLIIIVVGSYGDLVESLLKRSLSIKDSGEAIPGHGGFLDRFDGLLLSTPFIAAFLKMFYL